MNLNSNNSDNQRNANSQMNPGVRPLGASPPFNVNNPVGMQQARPLGMEHPNPNMRMENHQMYQQRQQQQQHLQQQQQQQQNLYQQQRNMYQNYPQRPPMGDQVRFQSNPASERPNGLNQNMPPGQQQGPRIQMAPQPRFPGPQPQMRPPLNDTNAFPMNQPRPQNFQQMERPRVQNNQNHINSQELSQYENYKQQTSRDPNQTLVRKSSNLDLDNHHKLGSPEILPQPKNNEKRANADNEKELDSSNAQQPIAENIKSEENEPNRGSIKNDDVKESNDNSSQSKAKPKENENKKDSIKDESITTGTVHKNIKFFEENDTAKIPLRPVDICISQKEKKANTSPSGTKAKSLEGDEDGSGVDETPMVHPNLRSIYQAPRKVAKIPHIKPSKTSRKYKSEKKSISRWPFEERFKNKQNPGSIYKPHNRKKQDVEIVSPKEELLAFFESSNTFRKCRRDGSHKSGENGTKLKVVLNSTTNGDIASPKKTPSKLPGPSKKNPPVSPTKTPLKSPGTPGGKSLPKTPETPSPPTPLIKKVPMNKIQVGAAPSPNLKAVRSKVGSLANTTHKPGGGNIKVETHKIDFSKTQPRIEAKNLQYAPSGGEKKITQVKLQWSAQSKVGSLENATYKPGGGDKKIESVKLDFKEKAKPKVGSKDNVKHVPGGGNIKIENQKLEFKAQSKVGSLDNVKHKPGGGDIKIFDDKTYLKQVSGNSSEGRVSGTQSYGDLSVVREIEGRSAPGTPGRKTAVKIRKITTIQSSGDSPTLKNVTEVTVVSQTPKKDKNVRISPTKEHVKLTYSKFSSSKNSEADGYVGIIKIPANEDVPILKSNLSRKDLSAAAEAVGQVNGSTKTDRVEFKEKKNLENLAQSSESPNLPDGKLNLKDDSGMSKFLKDEMAAHEKVGEIWKETIENKSNSANDHLAKQPNQDSSFYTNQRPGINPQQFRPQVSSGGLYTSTSQHSNINTNQNTHPTNIYRPQGEQNYQVNQQRLSSITDLPQGYRISPQQPPSSNAPQYENNYSK